MKTLNPNWKHGGVYEYEIWYTLEYRRNNMWNWFLSDDRLFRVASAISNMLRTRKNLDGYRVVKEIKEYDVNGSFLIERRETIHHKHITNTIANVLDWTS